VFNQGDSHQQSDCHLFYYWRRYVTKYFERFYKWAKGWLVLSCSCPGRFFAGFLMPLIGGHDAGRTGRLDPAAGPDDVRNTRRNLFAMIEDTASPHASVLPQRRTDSGYYLPHHLSVRVRAADLVAVPARLFPRQQNAKLNVMPLGAWFFDLLENLNIVTLLSIFPAKPMRWLAVDS
jgi:hypothetical protein